MFGEDFKNMNSWGTVRVCCCYFLQRDKYFSRDILIGRLCPQRDVGGEKRVRQITLTDSVAPLEQCRGHILLLFAEQSTSQQVTLPRMLWSITAGSRGTTTLCIKEQEGMSGITLEPPLLYRCGSKQPSLLLFLCQLCTHARQKSLKPVQCNCSACSHLRIDESRVEA